MKTSQLVADLKSAGCYLVKHGTRHDIWINPKNGKTTLVPRHGSKEIKKGTLMTILKELDLKKD